MIERPIEFNSLTMHDSSKSDLRVSPYYWIRLTSVDGIWGDELRVETHPLPCDIGESHGEVLKSGKQLVLTGEIYGLNQTTLRTGQWALQAACWDNQVHKLYFYNPAYSNTTRLYYKAYVNQPISMTDEFDQGTHWKQKWTVGLRADNPRSFTAADDTVYPTWQT